MKRLVYIVSVFLLMLISPSIVNADNGPTIDGNTTVKIGEQTQLTATFPNSCLGKSEPGVVCAQSIVDVTTEVDWKSSDVNIATIDNSGQVTGVKEGKAIITATYTHIDDTKVSSTYNITVTKENSNEYMHHMVLVLFNNENGQYDEVTEGVWNIGKVGEITKITPKLCDITGLKSDNTYDESYCSDIEVTYTSNDPSIAQVSADGNITNIKNGETVIVVKSKKEITIQADQKVTETPTVSLKVKVGEKEQQTVEKIEAPNTASPVSIIAIVISIALILAAVIYYFAVINKLQTWKKE